MILKNGLVFTENAEFVPADVELAGEAIVKVAPAGTLDGEEVLDVSGRYVTPGFVDIHIHGSKGSDFCDAGAEHIETMCEYLGSVGVTSFCGTTMAFDEPILTNLSLIHIYQRPQRPCEKRRSLPHVLSAEPLWMPRV